MDKDQKRDEPIDKSSKEEDELPPHWDRVKENCTKENSLHPECIDAWYAALGEENDLEWWLSLQRWFNNQPFIAFLGPFFA